MAAEDIQEGAHLEDVPAADSAEAAEDRVPADRELEAPDSEDHVRADRALAGLVPVVRILADRREEDGTVQSSPTDSAVGADQAGIVDAAVSHPYASWC